MAGNVRAPATTIVVEQYVNGGGGGEGAGRLESIAKGCTYITHSMYGISTWNVHSAHMPSVNARGGRGRRCVNHKIPAMAFMS